MSNLTKKLSTAGLLSLLVFGVAGGLSPKPAMADTTTFTLVATESDCTGAGSCCPNLKARVTVGTDGTWTVNVTDMADNPVPITVQPAASSETTTTYGASTPGSPGTQPGNTLPLGTTNTAPPSGMNVAGQGAGVVTGVSPNVAQGEANDQADNSGNGGLDVDSVTKFTIQFTRSCQNGCTGTGCTYKVKFTVTSDEGFSVSQTV